MRVLVNGFGAFAGGIVRVHDQVVAEFVSSGSETFVCNAPVASKPAQATVLTRQSGRRMFDLLKDWASAARPGTPHSFDLRIDTAPAVRPFTRSARRIVVVHDLNYLNPKIHGIGRKQRLYRSLLHRYLLTRPIRFAAVSDATANELRSLVKSGEVDVAVAPPPIDYLPVAQQRAPRTIRENDPISVLMFGHAKNKGVSSIFPLMSAVPTIYLTVICTPSQWSEYWEPICPLSIRNRIRLIANISDAELVAEYVDCDVFAMLSEYEGYGLPVAEALSLGVPTLVRDIPVLVATGRGFATKWSPASSRTLHDAILETVSTPAEHWTAASHLIKDKTWKAWVQEVMKDEWGQ